MSITPDILTAIFGAAASLIGATLVSSASIKELLRRILGKPEPKKTYADRLADLTNSLSSASSEVDSILTELSAVAREKETSVQQLEHGLSELENREKELKGRIAALENVPLPVAEHLAKILEPSEKRSAKRDYILFGAGVLVTTCITVLIQVITK